MPLPRVNQTIQDGALGLVDPSSAGVQIKAGVSSAGAVNTLTFYSDPTAMVAGHGQGPIVEAAAHVLATAGGPVGLLRVTGSVAGAAGSVTKTGTGTATMAVTGAPFDAYDVKVQITRNGTNLAALTAAFIYSLDGGDVYSAELAMPASGVYPVPNTSLTHTFTAGAGPDFVLGDVHAFTCTAPSYSATDLTNALIALRADPAAWGFVHVVGAASTPSGAATIATAVDVQMAAAEVQYRYAFAVVECPEETDANIKAAFLNFVSSRVVVAAGYCELNSALSGRAYKRNAAWPATARISQQKPQRDLGRVRDDKEGGALEGVSKLYRDEYVTEALDQARFLTLRTFPQYPGFFVTNGRMMAAPGSDYQFVQYRRVMDLACAANYRAMLPYLNDDAVRVDDVTGYINEIDARGIEAEVANQIRATLTSDIVSALQVGIKRDNNILSSQTLVESLRVIPRGYAKFINATIGFYNPALAPKAA